MRNQQKVLILALLGIPVLTNADVGRSDVVFDKHFSFVPVERGEFIMGSQSEEKGRFDDEVAHKVNITKPFEIGQTEVTQGLWKKVMGAVPKDTVVLDDNLPVTYVSWNDVQKFIKRLNEMRKGDSYQYRLPTEVEWEYSARGGHKASPEERMRPFYFGANPDQADEYSWNWHNSSRGLKPVATRKPNQLGLYDILGNVWEWTEDKYTPDGSKVAVHPRYGHPVNVTLGKDRVLRGGCTARNYRLMRSAYRGVLPANSPFGNLGVRLVRVAKSN